MSRRAANVAGLAAANLEAEKFRLQGELDQLRRRAELLEEAVVAAARGDVAPAERFAMLAAMGTPIVSSRAMLWSTRSAGFVASGHPVYYRWQPPSVCLLTRVVLIGDHPEVAAVSLTHDGVRMSLVKCPGDLLYDWGPIVLNEVVDGAGQLEIKIEQGSHDNFYNVVLLGEFARENLPPWASHYQGVP